MSDENPEEIHTDPNEYSLAGINLRTFKNLPGLVRAMRTGDQTGITEIMLDIASKDGTGVYRLNIPGSETPTFVVTSYAGLQEIATNPLIDKPDNLGVLTVGKNFENQKPTDAVMGPGWKSSEGQVEIDPSYSLQIGLIAELIKDKMKGLSKLTSQLLEEKFKPDSNGELHLDLDKIMKFSASIILSDLFPYHDWNDLEIQKVMNRINHNLSVVGPAFQQVDMMGGDLQDVLMQKELIEAQQQNFEFMKNLYEEEQSHKSEVNRGQSLLSLLIDMKVDTFDAISTVTSFLTASFETIGTTLNEFLYQTAINPDLWNELTQNKDKIGTALYEAVRIINPLPQLLRKTTADTIIDGRLIPSGSIVIGLLPGILMNAEYFPHPEQMRLTLTNEQEQLIRFAWGADAGKNSEVNRFCKGYAYSIAVLKSTFSHLLSNYTAPKVSGNTKITQFSTQSRKEIKVTLKQKLSK